MEILIVLGGVATLAGLAGLGWCIMQARRIRKAHLPRDITRVQLSRLVAVNLGSVGCAAIGLALIAAGLLL